MTGEAPDDFLADSRPTSGTFCRAPDGAGVDRTIRNLGNRPEALIQVRLFGQLPYEVTLSGIGISHCRLVYTHHLDTGEEWARLPDERS